MKRITSRRKRKRQAEPSPWYSVRLFRNFHANFVAEDDDNRRDNRRDKRGDKEASSAPHPVATAVADGCLANELGLLLLLLVISPFLISLAAAAVLDVCVLPFRIVASPRIWKRTPSTDTNRLTQQTGRS